LAPPKSEAEDGSFSPSTGLLDAASITKAFEDGAKHSVVVPCTFASQEEQGAAHRILPQFAEMEAVCSILVHILPQDEELDRESAEIASQRHDAMLAVGADKIILDPELEQDALRQAINLARSSWELNIQRVQVLLDAEPEPAPPEEVAELQAWHNRLLWESIPRTMMPHFRALDRGLLESKTHVDKYRLLKPFDTTGSNVVVALDTEGESCAIKVIDKSTVTTPGDLEGIYREFRFLSEIVRHPHVVRCLDMMHSSTRVYLVFEYAGNQNLAQLLSDQPGQRLDDEDSLGCFAQILSGLVCCHSVDVAHRTVALEHVVLSKAWQAEAAYHCKLVDFRSAMVARGETLSRTVCGGLPCIAPEMALELPYMPKLVDCWSLGVLLLETAGGLGSLSRCLPYDPRNMEPRAIARPIQQFFEVEGSQVRALACMGSVQSPQVEKLLVSLLQVEPRARAPLADLAAAAPPEGG